MRYSIMLQLVGFMTLIWIGAAAWFAWLENRPPAEPTRQGRSPLASVRAMPPEGLAQQKKTTGRLFTPPIAQTGMNWIFKLGESQS